MSLPVVLKSGKNYITLVLDDEISYEELLGAIVNKFIENQQFFGSQPFAITFEGRDLSEREQNIIIDALTEYTSVKITRIIENDEIKAYAAEKEGYDRSLPVGNPSQNNCLFLERDIKTGERITATDNLIIEGNVEEGAIIKAGANIIVKGALFGQAIAGDNPKIINAYIKADKFNPENIRIGSVLGKYKRIKKSVLSNHHIKPKKAEFTDGEIQIKSF